MKVKVKVKESEREREGVRVRMDQGVEKKETANESSSSLKYANADWAFAR